MTKIKEIHKYYKLPFYLDPVIPTSKIWSADDSMVIDFPERILADNNPYIKVTKEGAEHIIKSLNGEFSMEEIREYKREDSEIFVKINNIWYLFIVLRGWGNLTGIGAHNLKQDKAAEIQDAFGDWVIKMLRNE